MSNAHKMAPTMDDEEIIRQVVAGNTKRFEVLIRRYNSLLYSVAQSFGLKHQEAEEVMQEVHFSSFTELKNFQKGANYKVWITKILVRRCRQKINGDLVKQRNAKDE